MQQKAWKSITISCTKELTVLSRNLRKPILSQGFFWKLILIPDGSEFDDNELALPKIPYEQEKTRTRLPSTLGDKGVKHKLFVNTLVHKNWDI